MTSVLYVEAHSSGDSAFQSFSFSSLADPVSATPLGPEIPAAATRRDRYFSFEEISWMSSSRDSLEVTSELTGMIWPDETLASGLCCLAVFSRTSLRRPVMYTLAPVQEE